MVSLFVLVGSLILLRGLGALGARRLSSWREAGRPALAIMFLFTSFSHFSGLKHDFAATIPAPLPNDLWVIYLTGGGARSGSPSTSDPPRQGVAS